MTVFLALWLVGQVIAVLLVWHFVSQVGRPVGDGPTPPAVIVVAVKGHDIEFDGFLQGIFAQDYPEFRVIFGVESADDEAVPAIERYRAAYPGRVALVVAGVADHESQKIANVRATLAELKASDELLVFADADIWPQPDWLRRVAGPLLRGEADAISAYPWLVAFDHRFSTLLLMSISAGVATVPRHPMWDSAWGGVMGITHKRFKELGVAEAWRGIEYEYRGECLRDHHLSERVGWAVAAIGEMHREEAQWKQQMADAQPLAVVAADQRRRGRIEIEIDRRERQQQQDHRNDQPADRAEYICEFRPDVFAASVERLRRP